MELMTSGRSLCDSTGSDYEEGLPKTMVKIHNLILFIDRESMGQARVMWLWLIHPSKVKNRWTSFSSLITIKEFNFI